MRTPRLARILGAIVAGCLILCLADAAQAQEGGKRIALVVGNGGYRAVAGLGNPPNDARLLAQTLRAKGFILVGGDARIDLNRAQFNAALDEFAQALHGADVALFFYAGHGMQVRGANWLVPVDASPHRASDLDMQMVNAARVLTAMRAGGTKLNLVVLDACRDNPFPDLQTPGGETGLSQIQSGAGAGSRGLGPRVGGLAQMQAPEATVIAFATQPGDVAQDGAHGDSPFTVALVQALQAPGLDVLTLFNQVGVSVKHATGGQQQPWISSSPIEGSYFLGEDQTAGNAAATPPPSGPRSADSERVRAKVMAEAASRSIPVPVAIQITPPRAGVPPQLARFVGAWGPGRWTGRHGSDDFIVVVNDIDQNGQAHLTIMNSSGCVDPTCSVRAPFIGHTVASMQSGRLAFVSAKSGRAVSFWLVSDNQLAANQRLPARDLTTSLQRIK